MTGMDDIGQVEEESESHINVIKDGEVVGVSYIGHHRACITCKANVTAINDKVGVCTK